VTFGGVTYDPERDHDRLVVQLEAVRRLMSDGRWRTLPAISSATGAPEASVSARLRDLRKAKFGGRQVERRYVSRGLWEYRLLPTFDPIAPELPW
jgi:hypothetical protein